MVIKMDKEFSIILMEGYSRELGLMIKYRVTGLKKEQIFTKAIGSKGNVMGKAILD